MSLIDKLHFLVVKGTNRSTIIADESLVVILCDMLGGLATAAHARRALELNNNHIDRAAEYLLTYPSALEDNIQSNHHNDTMPNPRSRACGKI